MNLDQVTRKIRWMPAWLVRIIEGFFKKIPSVQKIIDQENDKLIGVLDHSLKPYRKTFDTFSSLPSTGVPREKILSDIQKMNELESPTWKNGYVSGGIYHGDDSHITFLNQVYALQSQSNPLHSDLFPSATKFEAEIVSMTAGLMGSTGDIVGTVTSGGTESILLAMKSYRDRALQERGVRAPEIIAPTTAHAAFDKASQYFKIKLVKIPVDQNFRVDVAQVKKKINANTIAIVGSAPTFPHGAIDPIEALSELAYSRGIGFHTDCCLGGFVLPFAQKLGYPVPGFDFRLRGVTSISIDTHKYGYAAKGTSVVLYRGEALRHYQYYTSTEWPGGLYFSPTLAGSRPGALSAACWAALLSVGESGYLNATKSILETATIIKEGLKNIPELFLLGDPLWVIAIGSNSMNIYEVMDQMSKRHWSLNGLHKPACFHIALTLRHTQVGVAERFLSDLKESVAHVKANPGLTDGLAPVYGLAASLPFRGVLSDVLKKYLDVIYKV